jgi:hypothetical protein
MSLEQTPYGPARRMLREEGERGIDQILFYRDFVRR